MAASGISGALKQTTGLTGLALARTPHHTLSALYKKTLGVLSKMPDSAAYRRHTEALVNQRLGIVLAEKEIAKIEEKVKSGQVEEMIFQAENELILARKMLLWKPWESLVKRAPANQWKWPI